VGDSFAPVQVLVAGSGDPGVSEPTRRVKEPADPDGETGAEVDTECPSTGAEDEPGAAHPTIPAIRIRKTYRTRNDRICIPERGHENR